MGHLKIFLILTFTFTGTFCDNKTDSAIISTTTMIPTTVAPENKTDTICKICHCEKTLINCENMKIKTFFTVEDWNGVKANNPREIIMKNNLFEVVTKFAELPVIRVDLSNGKITNIDIAAFEQLQDMAYLDLSHNNISSENLKPDVFKGKYQPELYTPLKSMRVLNISYNNLHSLDSDLFEHMTGIEELILSGNPFTLIDHQTVVAISSLNDLKILDLSECMLKSLPENFLHTPKYLEWLDISSNRIINIPPALEEAKSLKFLNISNNPIKYIEQESTVYTSFRKMPGLIELYMCHMPKLEEIKATSMSGLTNLRILHLHNNPALTKIDGTAFESPDPEGEGMVWPPIKEVYLSKNNLSTIDNTLIARWDLLEVIDIRHNPFLCDCSTQWMVNTLAPLVILKSPNMTSDIICHEPIEMRGKSLIHLEEIHTHMRCSDRGGNHPENDGLILVGVLIGVLITIPVIFGMIFIYKKGFFGFCGGKGPASFSRQFYTRTDTNDIL